ncbi:MAG: 50S ribosomal protein L6 [Clostridiales Family XIII bacterium]|jgi:large subunit ribosomal protein L6|nr:50S ribosomal protein L6 [Clostridiales Family XIII bacterium]
MSRIGKIPVTIPAGVEVTIDAAGLVTVKGPKGELSEKISGKITVKQEDGVIHVTRSDDQKESRSLHGLSRTLIGNMVTGVSEGFERKLEIIGVGYKADKQGDKLVLSLGYSHPVELFDPNGITTETPSATEILVKGIDKAAVGNYAAIIRAWRPPEPYKGKGVRYSGEKVRRKEGKAGVKGS